MKKIFILTAILFALSAFNVSLVAAQSMGPGYGYQQPQRWNFCPNCGRYLGRGQWYGMGHGMTDRGYGMGPGMMGRGYGMGPGMMGPQYSPQYGSGYQDPRYQKPQKPMDKTDTRELLENYLQSTRNPNLKLGKIEDKGNAFEAESLIIFQEPLTSSKNATPGVRLTSMNLKKKRKIFFHNLFN